MRFEVPSKLVPRTTPMDGYRSWRNLQ